MLSAVAVAAASIFLQELNFFFFILPFLATLSVCLLPSHSNHREDSAFYCSAAIDDVIWSVGWLAAGLAVRQSKMKIKDNLFKLKPVRGRAEMSTDGGDCGTDGVSLAPN